jgi:hypothetical protein
MLKIAATEEFGVYHCTGNGECSWFEFAEEILRLADFGATALPCTSAEYPSPTKRPAYSSLEHMMLRTTVGDEMRRGGKRSPVSFLITAIVWIGFDRKEYVNNPLGGYKPSGETMATNMQESNVIRRVVLSQRKLGVKATILKTISFCRSLSSQVSH